MNISHIAAAGCTAAALACAAPAAAQENGVCRIGATVTDRQGRTGVVVGAPDKVSCNYRTPDGTVQYALTWMLAAGKAPAAAPNGGKVTPGAYQCYGGAAGNMKLNFQGGGRYSNEQGKAGAFTQDGARIAFTSGPWAGFYGAVLPDGKVGLSSKPNTRSFYMTCERK